MDRRFELALGHFETALRRFEEVLAHTETDIVRDSIIKRFEFTFETAWKACYRWLRARGVDIDEEAFAVLPRAFQNRLVDDEHVWSEMFLKSPDSALTLTRAREVAAWGRERGDGKGHLVFAPAKYMSHKQLLEHGIEFAQLPFALYRET